MQISVQYCIDCHLHSLSMRHDQSKYRDFYQKLEARIKSQLPNAKVTRNIPPKHYLKMKNLGAHRYFNNVSKLVVTFPQEGAFEVTVSGMLIFSKIKSRMWPSIQKVAYIIASIQHDLGQGNNTKPVSSKSRLVNKQEGYNIFDSFSYIPKMNMRPFCRQGARSVCIMQSSSKKTVRQISGSKRKPSQKQQIQGQDIKLVQQKIQSFLIETVRSSNTKLRYKKSQQDYQQLNQSHLIPFRNKHTSKSYIYSARTRKRSEFKSQNFQEEIKPQPIDPMAKSSSKLTFLQPQADTFFQQKNSTARTKKSEIIPIQSHQATLSKQVVSKFEGLSTMSLRQYHKYLIRKYQKKSFIEQKDTIIKHQEIQKDRKSKSIQKKMQEFQLTINPERQLLLKQSSKKGKQSQEEDAQDEIEQINMKTQQSKKDQGIKQQRMIVGNEDRIDIHNSVENSSYSQDNFESEKSQAKFIDKNYHDEQYMLEFQNELSIKEDTKYEQHSYQSIYQEQNQYDQSRSQIKEEYELE